MLLKIAFRNIFRHKRRSILTGMMMAGAFVLFSLSFGFVDGGYDMIIDMFTRDRTGHVQVHVKGYLDKHSLYKKINDVESVGAIIGNAAEVLAWAPRIYGPALAFAGRKTTALNLMGIDPDREPLVTRLREKVSEGSFVSDDPLAYEIILPAKTARILKIGLGDEVALISQAADGSPATELFTVVGLVEDKNSSYGDMTAFTHIDTARDFFVLGKTAHEITVLLSNHWQSREAASLINLALAGSDLEASPWEVVEAQFYKAMQADLKGNWITLTVLTVIVAVGVLNTILMVILERTREYGVLKAIGTRPSQVFMLIVLETLILAGFSILAGAIGGIAANGYFAEYGITYPEPIEWGGMTIQYMKARITLRTLWIPSLVIFATALLVSIWPAIRAARIVPVKALREG
ncbi:MAG: FtsX-like permease family protein [Proteobacteria bacterium]|nr:FtsX-like permease family protein [Pseudomonadota bacterium]MBU1738032.1 FtsX-like permease family protein [Pseudomonadota bacterium]